MSRSAKPKPKKSGKSPRRVPSEITVERERKAWDLRQQFYTLEQIARTLKVDTSTVCRILQRVERRTLAELSEDIAAVKARQTAQLERIAAEAFQGWQASQRDTITTKTTPGSSLKIGTKRARKSQGKSDLHVCEVDSEPAVEVTVKTNAGAPAFLAEVRGALSDIRKIWGMDAKPDQDDGDGQTPLHPDIVSAMARGIAEGLKAAGVSSTAEIE